MPTLIEVHEAQAAWLRAREPEALAAMRRIADLKAEYAEEVQRLDRLTFSRLWLNPMRG